MRDMARPHGEVFLDARGNGRAMRLTWHHEADLVVLSLWRDGTCASTFRLSKDDVNEFIDALIDGLRDAPGIQLPAQGSHRAAVAERADCDDDAHQGDRTKQADRTEPQAPIETGQSTFPEFSDEDAPSFTEWAFGDRANAS